MLETVPLTFERGGNFSLTSSHGERVSCLIPHEIFISSEFADRILTFRESPGLYFEARSTFSSSHERSET